MAFLAVIIVSFPLPMIWDAVLYEFFPQCALERALTEIISPLEQTLAKFDVDDDTRDGCVGPADLLWC